MKGFLGGFLSGLVFSVLLLLLIVIAVNVHRRRRTRQLKNEIMMSSLASPCLLDIRTITDDRDDAKREIVEAGNDNEYEEPPSIVSAPPKTSDNVEPRYQDLDKDVKFRRLKEDADDDVEKKSSIGHTYMTCEETSAENKGNEEACGDQGLYQNIRRTKSGYKGRELRRSERRQTTV